MRVSEIRVNQIRANQGLGVIHTKKRLESYSKKGNPLFFFPFLVKLYVLRKFIQIEFLPAWGSNRFLVYSLSKGIVEIIYFP